MILIALISSGVPADIDGEQTGEPNRYGESSVADMGHLAGAGSGVWMAFSLRNIDH